MYLYLMVVRFAPMAQTASELLASLADEYWQAFLSNEPVFATALGDRRYNDKLSDITPKGRKRVESKYELILERAREIPESSLSAADKLTRTALLAELQAQLDHLSCHLEQWTIDPRGGLQVEFLNGESFQPIRSVEEARAMVKRWQTMGPYMDDHVANLRHGLAMGKVGVRTCVEKVIDEVQELAGKPDEDLALLRPLKVPHDDWTAAERTLFHDGISGAVRESIRPAFLRYLKFLQLELQPKARPQELPGIMHVPGGSDCYRRLIRVHTSLNLSSVELHMTGLGEVARINKEMELLGEKLFGTRDRKELLRRLRTDPSLHFKTRDEVAEKAESALARAKNAIPKWFGRLPKADCKVVRMAEHEEKHATTAYYRQPAVDGSRPGQYYINTYAPETRPRYEAEALAYHESIPGHHLQIAIAQELEGLPEFRKHSGVGYGGFATAFVEGWGLYAEGLADEMGLYSSDLDRMGALSYDAWRACRLVVDTGMHAKKWSRRRAIDFMLENTALAQNNIVNEVDRYIADPAQALAYKTGQIEILRLREEAKQKLRDRFDLPEFHDALLGDGAVPLKSLQHVVELYIAHRLENLTPAQSSTEDRRDL
jgi:uncharacterized protein (DUF885 family)